VLVRFRAPLNGQGMACILVRGNIDEVGWPQCGEIDIMEYRGQEPTKVKKTVWSRYSGEHHNAIAC
jgi:beta-glucanase (GH16 family)